VLDLKPILTTEFNIEGNPTREFVELVKKVKPAQVTLVPDAHDALTSNAGWDTKTHQDFLKEIVSGFQQAGIRVSIFVDTNPVNIEYAAKTGTDRVELYTEPYATNYPNDKAAAVAPFVQAAKLAKSLGLGINAGHDLSLDNLAYLHQNIPWLEEVSIGHALIADALYLGLEETIKRYKAALK
jgi:pyridoxine 5-phosphate synthase